MKLFRASTCQTLLIFGLIVLQAEWTSPQTNEAHYLAKARHYWSPDWCGDDLFLQSADAHLVFYWSVGWLTAILPFWAVAWFGRLSSWLFISFALQRIGAKLFGDHAPGFTVAAAGLFFLLLARFDLAGEWVIGGFEAKLIAYGFGFYAIANLLDDRWRWTIVLLGLSTMFHVLVGGWLMIAVGFVWLTGPRRRPTVLQLLPYAVVAAIFASVAVFPALSLGNDAGLRPGERDLVYGIYIYQRLAHHLVFSRIAQHKVLWHLGLLAVWIVTQVLTWKDTRQRILFQLVLAAVLLALIGVSIDWLESWESSRPSNSDELGFFSRVAFQTLRFYWFRLSDVLIPFGTAMGLLVWLHRNRAAPRFRYAGLTLVLLLVGSHLIDVRVERWVDPRPAATRNMLRDPDSRQMKLDHFHDWKAACAWIHSRTPEDSLWLTPRLQQTFKWYAQRAEVVNWKDTPQDVRYLKEWWERIIEVYNPDDEWYYGLATHTSDRLVRIARKYRARFVLIDRDNFDIYRREVKHDKLVSRYQNEFYEVFEVID